MKTKVLYIITSSDVGGAQKYVADLTNNLDKSRFEAKILYGGRNLKWLSNQVRPWTLFSNDWLAILELVKLYQKERPHIIHLNSSKAGILGTFASFIYNLKSANRETKARVVFTVHGWVFNPTNDIAMTIRWFYVLLHKFAALFQEKIICVSEYDRQLALKYKIAAKTKLANIHNGINPDIQFLDKHIARKELLKKLPVADYQLPVNSFWIGSIGRLVKEKNYETFIRAAALIPNANFFIIGKGPEISKLKTKNSKLRANVFIIDPTGRDAQYLKAFDIFVMSSVKEGLPYILLEAMAAGLPAVVTEAGGMPEMIKNHENGLLVAQKNPEMLAKAIQSLLINKNVAQQLGQMTKKIVREKFGLEKMVAETTKVYEFLSPNP